MEICLCGGPIEIRRSVCSFCLQSGPDKGKLSQSRQDVPHLDLESHTRLQTCGWTDISPLHSELVDVQGIL